MKHFLLFIPFLAAFSVMPAVASAGSVPLSPDSAHPWTACSTTCPPAGGWSFRQKNDTRNSVRITPRANVTYRQFDRGFVAFGGPTSTFDDTSLEYRARVTFSSTTIGQNWRVFACQSATTGSDTCTAATNSNAYQVRPGQITPTGTAVIDVPLGTIGNKKGLRVGLQHAPNNGQTTKYTGTSIEMSASVQWYVVDKTAPTVTLTAGDDEVKSSRSFNASQTTDGLLPLTVEADDNTGVTTRLLAIDGSLVSTDSPYNLRDGAHKVGFLACDGATPANCAGGNYVLTVDAGYPQATWQNKIKIVSNKRPLLKVRVIDPILNKFASGIDGIPRVFVDDAQVGATVTKEGDIFSIVLQSDLADGEHTFTLSIADRLGNRLGPGGDVDSPSLTLLTDTKPMKLIDVTPTPNQLHVKADDNIGATFDDGDEGSGFSYGSLYLDKIRISGANSDGELAYTGKLCPGSHTAQATGADKADNKTSYSWKFSVDGTPSKSCNKAFAARQKPNSPALSTSKAVKGKGTPVHISGSLQTSSVKSLKVQKRRLGSSKYSTARTIKVVHRKYKTTVYFKTKGTYQVRVGFKYNGHYIWSSAKKVVVKHSVK